MRASLQLIPEQPAQELLQAAQVADELGYYACYSADEIYHKDAWLLLAAAAARSERIRLGPCVSPIYLRDPTYVAQLAGTLDELSGGRAEVVLGIGNLATLEQYGIEWRGTRPIARLREAIHVIRTLLDEGSIDFQGDFFRYTGVTTAARPVQQSVPLKVGAMSGPKSIELAGELADGIHTACAYSPDALRFVVHAFDAGAAVPAAMPSYSTSATRCSGRSPPTQTSPGARAESSPRSTSPRCHPRCSSDTTSIPKRWRRSTRRFPQATSSVRST